MDLTIEVSSGCTTSVGVCTTTRPFAATTMSTGMSAAAVVSDVTSAPTVQMVERAPTGGRAAISAADGDWNSSSAAEAVASAGALKGRRKLNMAGCRSLRVTVLL